MPPAAPSTPLIADAFIHVQCAYTSLARWKHFGLLDRECPWFARIAPLFRRFVLVTYGGSDDHALAASLVPAEFADRVTCIANDHADEPARFQAGIPARVLSSLSAQLTRSALVFTDQHYGGEVAIAIADAIRASAIRTGLVARGGYHWSWFTARDHGPDSPQAALAAAREGELCRAADIVIGSTRRMIDDLAYRHALPPDKLRIIPNFVSLAGDASAALATASREPNFILAAGRLEPQKRFDLLVRAVAHLAKTHPAVHLRIYGEGSLHAELTALIRELRAPVEILPRIPQTQLAAEMSRCAAFAQVSAFEGHPKTIIEALAHGAPVVVTRGAGVDDEITPGVTGLITRDDPAAIAAAIGTLLDDPHRAAHMGLAAAADIRARLGLDTIFPLVETACREALILNGTHTTRPSGTVRWDQTLLNADPADSAAAFASSIHAYAKRLDPEAREAFHDALAAAFTPHPTHTPASSTT